MTAAPSLMAGLVPVLYRRFPAKRLKSTLVSAAMTTRSARRISSGVSGLPAPTLPWVSIFTSYPSAFAPPSSPSAAMNVWAIPVGQDVMPMMYFFPPATGAAAALAALPPAWAIRPAALRMASCEPARMIRFPANRASSTRTSTARITASAAAISAADRASAVPTLPCVSTRMWCPAARAARRSASAAMNVWAIPVGQAVTATNCAMGCLLGRV